MLLKRHRLVKDRDFNKIFQSGQSFKENFLSAKVVKNNSGVTRVGFSVSLKISKKSTERNKIKRRLRESVRLKLPEIKPGFDLVIIARPEIKDKSYSEIDQGVRNILRQAGLIK